jgi:hypothetical protein
MKKKLAALLGLGVVAAVVTTSVLVFSGSGTAQAARPFVNVSHLHVHDTGGCTLSTHVIWDGTQFAHRNGWLELRVDRTFPLGAVSDIFRFIPKGTLGEDINIAAAGNPQATGKSYLGRAFFWTGRGQGGGVVHRLIGGFNSAAHPCPS